MYPELMSSTVKKTFYLMPDVWSSPAAPVLDELYNVEGSAAATIVVPNSFFIPIHGTATKDAAPTYKFTLSDTNDKIIGKQHFENKKGTAEAKGEYSVDIEICNPDCDVSLWDSKP